MTPEEKRQAEKDIKNLRIGVGIFISIIFLLSMIMLWDADYGTNHETDMQYYNRKIYEKHGIFSEQIKNECAATCVTMYPKSSDSNLRASCFNDCVMK